MTQEDVQKRIATEVAENPIIMYVKGSPAAPMCGFSKGTMDMFHSLGVPFKTVDVLTEPGIRDGIKQFTNWPTIPQVFIKGQFVGGYDIIKEMHASGELAKMIKG